MVEISYNAQQVLLPNPQFGDTVGVHLRNTVHIAMDGTFWTYVQTPVPKLLVMDFAHLDRAKILEITTFIRSNRGKWLRLVDHRGQVWTAKITTNPFTSIHSGRNNSNFTIEFETV